jgi:hypothetical protein
MVFPASHFHFIARRIRIYPFDGKGVKRCSCVLKPGGLLAVHITNGFLDLTPVLAAAPAEMNTPAVLMNNAWNATRYADAANWVLMGGDFNSIEALRHAGGMVLTATPGFRPWTDDYSSLLGLLR